MVDLVGGYCLDKRTANSTLIFSARESRIFLASELKFASRTAEPCFSFEAKASRISQIFSRPDWKNAGERVCYSLLYSSFSISGSNAVSSSLVRVIPFPILERSGDQSRISYFASLLLMYFIECIC